MYAFWRVWEFDFFNSLSGEVFIVNLCKSSYKYKFDNEAGSKAAALKVRCEVAAVTQLLRIWAVFRPKFIYCEWKQSE